jgi:PAS domain S-box-containing protein
LITAETGHESLGALSEQILKNLVVGVVVQRPEGEIISANNAAGTILSLSMEQLHGRTSFDPSWHSVDEDGELLPGDRHPAMEAIQTAEAARKIMGIYSGSESITWIDACSTPIFDSEMTLVGVSTSFIDITDQKKALESEIATKKYYERISAEASDVSLTLGTDGRVLTASLSSEDLFGLPSENLSGQLFEDLIPADEADGVRTLINNVSAATSSSGRMVIQLRQATDGLRAYDLSLKNLMSDPVTPFLLCTLRDVDQLFNLQADLAEANAELSRSITELKRAADIDGYLSEALEMLIRCQSLHEVGEVIWDCLYRVFVDSELALYLVDPNGTDLRLFRQIGGEFDNIPILSEKCWAIRTRHVHLNVRNGVRCEHHLPENCSVCLPFFFESRMVAWAQIQRDGEDCELLEVAANKIFRRLLHSIPEKTLAEVIAP